jgi:hypothetical protein
MSGNRLLITIFIILTFAIWISLDVWLNANGGPTESQVLRDWGMAMTFFPHLVGFLMGHWFFPRRTTLSFGWMIAIPIWAVLISWDIWWDIHHPGVTPWYRFPGIWAMIGAVCGSILWGQPNSQSPLP